MTNEPRIPKSCDWVTARSECSIERVFIRLRELVESDIRVLLVRQTDDIVELRSADERRFTVSIQWNAGGVISGEAVAFQRNFDGTIEVLDQRTQTRRFLATPRLNDAGECQLVDKDGVCLELWQVSRKALEPHFFRTR